MLTTIRIASAVVAALLVVSVPATAAAAPAGGLPRALEAGIEQALREWEVPGAAIAVVKDDRVVFLKGYGVRRLGAPERVDASTLFDVASLTKAFTAAAVATVVDEGRMTWDTPVRRYLPTLQFPDPERTAQVTMRDLLCHRTGMRPTNWAWSLTGVTRPQLLTLVDSMQAAAPFRTRLTYWNIGYAIAGEAAAAASGMPWEDLVTRRLLAPLGMTRSTVDFDSVPVLGNFTSGHAVVGGVHQPIPRETQRRSTAPAGVLHASAADLATWMRFQLGDGTFGGKRIVSAVAMNEMHSAQIVGVPSPEFRAARQVRHLVGYGLGWQVFDYQGHTMLWHSGNGDGHLAYLALLPEHRLGVVVLVNSWRATTALNGNLAGRILDHYLGSPKGKDYDGEFRAHWTRNEQRNAEYLAGVEAARLTGTTPTLPLSAYAGTYRDPLGLDVAVTLEADTLRLRHAGGEPATLVHWHGDGFRARWANPFHAELLPVYVAFGIGEDGSVDRLRMDPYSDDVEARRRTP